jgi:hypothetical protein
VDFHKRRAAARKRSCSGTRRGEEKESNETVKVIKKTENVIREGEGQRDSYPKDAYTITKRTETETLSRSSIRQGREGENH